MGKHSKRKDDFQGRSYVLGDLHGAYKALVQVLDKVGFDNQKDKLIFLGDLADGWKDWDKCLYRLMNIQNFYPLLGNHDLYLKNFVLDERLDDRWLFCGGDRTSAFILENRYIIDTLKVYFEIAKPYHIHKDKIFCHGGFDPKKLITNQNLFKFSTDRKLYKTAKAYENQGLKLTPLYDENDSIIINEIFIGHSTTKSIKPSFRANLVNLDTGCGSWGCLTLMDVEKKCYVQSDITSKLYAKN